MRGSNKVQRGSRKREDREAERTQLGSGPRTLGVICAGEKQEMGEADKVTMSRLKGKAHAYRKWDGRVTKIRWRVTKLPTSQVTRKPG